MCKSVTSSGFMHLPDNWQNTLTMCRKESRIPLSIPNSLSLVWLPPFVQMPQLGLSERIWDKEVFWTLCWCLEISLLCPVWNNCSMSKNDQLDGCLLLPDWGIVDLHNFLIPLWDHLKHLTSRGFKGHIIASLKFFPLSNTGWNCSNSKLFWGKNQTNTCIHAPKSSGVRKASFS